MSENDKLIRLGIEFKKIRKSKNLTLREIANKTKLSKSLISKIENLRTIPSLPVVIKIADALNKNLSELFTDIGVDESKDYILVPKNKRELIEREQSKGFKYYSLVIKNKSNLVFESFFVTLEKYTKRKLITTNGDQFIFIIKGSIELMLRDKTINLKKGDSIYFDGRIPHVTRNTYIGNSEFIVIYLLE
jgi:transcriptional regulator with XRE-family HTH domain